MSLRVNDGPYREGLFKDNFVFDSPNKYRFTVHRLKDGGKNYEQVFATKMGIKPGSAAEECANGLIWGCDAIEVLELSEGNYVACFRDSRVQVSRYLGITDFQKHLEMWLR